ncbi:MAG: hypothetical protein AAGU05_06160, partial [Anaerolineaceae bacterium]
RQSSSDDRSPVWSTDGSTVFWSRAHNGARQIVRYDPVAGSQETLAAGSRPLVSPDGKSVLILNEGPQDTQAVVISSGTGKSLYLPVLLPGEVMGMTWVTAGHLPALEQALRVLDPDGAASVPPAQTHDRSGSNTLSALEGVNVPQPYLTSDVLPSFNTLRQQVELAVGWNFMDILENAFVPITQPSAPEMDDSWLYTGRAVALNTAPLYGGWMCVVRQDYYGQTYWRVYLKTRYQDGSQGLPIREQVWDFTTRTSGDTSAYEQGGSLARAPEGYWVDFTSLAAQYGWSRVPAVPIWRSYMDGALYNLYVQIGDLSWLAAMRELYPPEALATATRVPTLVPTPAARP